jgi:hypothetical protein
MHSLFIAPANSEQWFNAQADILGNNGPALVMALSANGQEPATHGWCAITLAKNTETMVQALLDANPDKEVVWSLYDQINDSDFPRRQIDRLGLKLIQIPF